MSSQDPFESCARRSVLEPLGRRRSARPPKKKDPRSRRLEESELAHQQSGAEQMRLLKAANDKIAELHAAALEADAAAAAAADRLRQAKVSACLHTRVWACLCT